jgi:hypothetical protein
VITDAAGGHGIVDGDVQALKVVVDDVPTATRVPRRAWQRQPAAADANASGGGGHERRCPVNSGVRLRGCALSSDQFRSFRMHTSESFNAKQNKAIQPVD